MSLKEIYNDLKICLKTKDILDDGFSKYREDFLVSNKDNDLKLNDECLYKGIYTALIRDYRCLGPLRHVKNRNHEKIVDDLYDYLINFKIPNKKELTYKKISEKDLSDSEIYTYTLLNFIFMHQNESKTFKEKFSINDDDNEKKYTKILSINKNDIINILNDFKEEFISTIEFLQFLKDNINLFDINIVKLFCFDDINIRRDFINIDIANNYDLKTQSYYKEYIFSDRTFYFDSIENISSLRNSNLILEYVNKINNIFITNIDIRKNSITKLFLEIPMLYEYFDSIKTYLNIIKPGVYDYCINKLNDIVKLCLTIYIENKNIYKHWLNKFVRTFNDSNTLYVVDDKFKRSNNSKILLYYYIKNLMNEELNNNIDICDKYGLTANNLTNLTFNI